MISVEARGRLGNHLFQFAFGLAASMRLGTDFAINDELLWPNFRLEPWGSPRRRVARSIRYRFETRSAPLPVVKIAPEDLEEPHEVLERLQDGVHYSGFFQSELFFDEVATEVRRAFRARPKHERALRERYGALLDTPYVCCHVRQTDYREWGGGLALPGEYYRACLRRLDIDPATPIVAVGDDLDWLRDELADERIRYERNDEVVDLLLLANARELVLSNSSFAWWGGWLNLRAKRVLAPLHWIGFKEGRELPHRVVARDWEQVPVGPAVTTAPG